MEEDTEPYETVDSLEEVMEEAPEVHQEVIEKQVPLSALQRERKKRQEIEQELYMEKGRNQRPAPEPVEDNSRYESATKEDLINSQQEAIRVAEERAWIRNNREKFDRINDELPQFLKQRPNLASAINEAPNRYEEAYTLMNALAPKQQVQQKILSTPKREAPNAPGGVPKSTAMSHNVDVMNMSDKEFSEWRGQQKKRR